MEIPREWLERYSQGLNRVSERGLEQLEQALAAVDFTQGVATVRQQLVAIMQTCCGTSASMAARLAAEFYDGLRLKAGVSDGFRAQVDPCRDPKATEGAVRAFVQPLVDAGPVAAEKIKRSCADRLDQESREAANRCVERNAKRDPKKPRWARVPMGAETCKWCIMLAGRGFKYHAEELASHSHPNCDCRVIPSWDGKTTIAGYDPKYYEDCYRHPEDHPEIRDAINARRRELYAKRHEAERAERIRKRIESAEVVHDRLYEATPKEIAERAEEIGREERNRWENGFRKTDRSAASYRRTYGKYVESFSPEGRITVEDFTRLEAKELQLAQWLADAGHTVEFRNADAHNANDGKTTDVFLDGVLWEFKRSETKNVKKMAGLITERLDRQGPRFVLDLSISKTDRDKAIEKVASLLDDPEISEILVVRDGKAVLYKK